jgi:Mrp family chromosome partitioning ATPase/capsular polysaccharide biosynthesis protein
MAPQTIVTARDRAATISPTILRSVVRFRRVVLLAAILGAVIGAGLSLIASPVYAGKAGIVLQPLPASLTPGAANKLNSIQYVSSQVALLQSAQVASDAASIVNQKFPDSHMTQQTMQGATSVKLPTGTGAGNSTTTVVVTLPQADIAAAAANAVIAGYLKEVKNQVKAEAKQSTSAINTEIQSVTSQINAIPASGTKTPTSTSVPNTTPTTSHPTATTSHVGTTTTHPQPTTTTHAHTTTTHTATTTAFDGSAQAVLGTSSPDASPAAELVADSTTTTAATSAASGATTTTGAGNATTAGGSSTTVAGGTGSTTTTASPQQQAANNDAQRAALQSTLSSLTRSLSQVQVNEQLNLSFLPQIYPATVAQAPANQHFLRNFLIGLLAGLLIGVVAAYALSLSRRRFDGQEDPQRFYGAALVAAVPAFEVPMWLPGGLTVLTDPSEEAAEAYREIATTLRSLRGEADGLLVAVTAADQGAGVTTTVANVGLLLAEMGERVLVVDADPLFSGLTQLLVEPSRERGLPQRPPGLSEVLRGHEIADAIQPCAQNPDLFVMPTGRDTNMAVHRWRSETMRSTLETLNRQFEIVLIDTPPLGTSSFGMDVAAAAGDVLLVIPHHDRVDRHEEIARRLPLVGATVLGYVYNGVPAKVTYAPYYPALPPDPQPYPRDMALGGPAGPSRWTTSSSSGHAAEAAAERSSIALIPRDEDARVIVDLVERATEIDAASGPGAGVVIDADSALAVASLADAGRQHGASPEALDDAEPPRSTEENPVVQYATAAGDPAEPQGSLRRDTAQVPIIADNTGVVQVRDTAEVPLVHDDTAIIPAVRHRTSRTEQPDTAPGEDLSSGAVVTPPPTSDSAPKAAPDAAELIRPRFLGFPPSDRPLPAPVIASASILIDRESLAPSDPPQDQDPAPTDGLDPSAPPPFVGDLAPAPPAAESVDSSADLPESTLHAGASGVQEDDPTPSAIHPAAPVPSAVSLNPDPTFGTSAGDDRGDPAPPTAPGDEPAASPEAEGRPEPLSARPPAVFAPEASGEPEPQVSPPSIPPGWLPDPFGSPDTLRYWDGQAWTDHFATREPSL